MKLIWHGYLVPSLGICIHKIPTETAQSSEKAISGEPFRVKLGRNVPNRIWVVCIWSWETTMIVYIMFLILAGAKAIRETYSNFHNSKFVFVQIKIIQNSFFIAAEIFYIYFFKIHCTISNLENSYSKRKKTFLSHHISLKL